MPVKYILNACLESFYYLLYASSKPTKLIFLSSPLEQEFSSAAIYRGIDRLYNKGYIHKIRKGKGLLIRFSRKPGFCGRDHTHRLKIENATKKWDGKWRLLIYDIPEEMRSKRNLLRVFISELGFGKIQESCWASAHDFNTPIYDFCREHKLIDCICLYEGKFFAGKNIDELIKNAWDLTAIAAEYTQLIASCKENIETITRNKSKPIECFRVYYEVYSSYQKVIGRDPYLPDEFLRNWPRGKAEEAFRDLAAEVSRVIIPA